MAQRLGRILGTALIILATLPKARLLAQTDSGNEPVWTTGWSNSGEATSLLLDPSRPSRLFAGTELGLATSEDGGRTWSLQSGTPGFLLALALDPSNPSRLVGGSNDGVFTSSDGGAHFTRASSNVTMAIAMDPAQPQTMYAAGGGPAVQKTTDGGASWTSSTINTALTQSIAALIVDPRNHDDVFAGVGSWEFVYAGYYYPNPPPASIVGSDDAGKTWKLFLDDTSASQSVRALAFDPRTSQTIYAGRGPYVYRSSNGGVSWTPGTFSLGSIVTSLSVDSLTPDTIYAGTDQGVYRSADAGRHWAPLPLLPNMDVRAIALDPAAQVLHAATATGVYEAALSTEAPSFPCVPTAQDLCLLGGRFRARARAWNPASGRFTTGNAVPETDAFGYFSLPEFTGDASLPEVLLKMVDAEIPPWNADWVFHGSLTGLWYVLTVTDTLTGEVRAYQNDLARTGCGGADTAAFPPPPSPVPARVPRARPLQSDGAALALLSGRFQLTLSATDPNTGRTIFGSAIPRADAFGYFSLPDLTGDGSLPEVFVKMLDARPIGGGFWLFQTGLTNVGYVLTLTDSVSGAVRTYSPPGPFCGTADTRIPEGP